MLIRESGNSQLQNQLIQHGNAVDGRGAGDAGDDEHLGEERETLRKRSRKRKTFRSPGNEGPHGSDECTQVRTVTEIFVGLNREKSGKRKRVSPPRSIGLA